jgi:pimeloyl-ACP methyl ester carboxylesterase
VVSRTIDLDGPVHFADFGGSGAPIVLVHGLGGSHVNWMSVGPGLAAHGRIVAPDLAGFGRTPPAGRSSGVRAQQRLLASFLDFVAPDDPVILVGNSMGGLIAMLEAAARPERITRLILVGPAQPRPTTAMFDPLVALTFAAYAFPGVGEMVMRWRAARLGPEGVVRQSLALCCADSGCLPAEVVAAHVTMARERSAIPWGQAAFLEATRSILGLLRRRSEMGNVIQGIRAPTLVIQGTEDRLVPVAASRGLVRGRGDWELVVFEGVGHVPMLEVPEKFVETVVGWLGNARASREGLIDGKRGSAVAPG